MVLCVCVCSTFLSTFFFQQCFAAAALDIPDKISPVWSAVCKVPAATAVLSRTDQYWWCHYSYRYLPSLMHFFFCFCCGTTTLWRRWYALPIKSQPDRNRMKERSEEALAANRDCARTDTWQPSFFPAVTLCGSRRMSCRLAVSRLFFVRLFHVCFLLLSLLLSLIKYGQFVSSSLSDCLCV